MKLFTHPRRLGSRGLSLAYGLFYGLFGMAIFGLLYTILDQITMGDVWNFAVNRQLSGTILSIFKSGWDAIPVIVVGSFLIGMIAIAHFTKNE